MTRLTTGLTGLLASLCLAACGGSGGFTADDINEGAPTGRIEGTAWTAVEAGARMNDGDLTIELFAEDVDECSPFSDTDLGTITFLVPPTVGEYELSFDLSNPFGGRVVNFITPDVTNVLATDGLIVVNAVDADSIEVGVVAMTGNSDINGTITVPRCE